MSQFKVKSQTIDLLEIVEAKITFIKVKVKLNRYKRNIPPPSSNWKLWLKVILLHFKKVREVTGAERGTCNIQKEQGRGFSKWKELRGSNYKWPEQVAYGHLPYKLTHEANKVHITRRRHNPNETNGTTWTKTMQVGIQMVFHSRNILYGVPHDIRR